MADSTAIVVPSTFKGAAKGFLAAAGADESLAEGIGSSYGIVHYRGKVWSIQYRGEKYTFTRPDDGSPINYLDVIILRSANVKSKSFYPRVEGQSSFDADASTGKKPACASLDGLTPDTDYNPPQAAHCSICPRNEWKTDANGKKSRECQDYKRTAVLIVPTQTERIMGQKLMEPVFLRIPPASLNGLGTLGDVMQKQGYPYFAYVTRIKFDPEKPHPEFIYSPLQELSEAEVPVILGLREDPIAKRITGEDIMGRQAITEVKAPLLAAPLGAPPPSVAAPVAVTPPAAAVVAASPAAPVVAPVVAPVAPPTQVAPPAAVSPSEGLGLAPGAVVTQVTGTVIPPATPLGLVTASITAAAPITIEGTATSLGLVGGPSPPLVPAQPAVQTAEDIGMPTESDAGLDAQIAEMLKNA